ncbi:MAG TPA: hypothetical protein ENK18_25550 [Deltaproteobacteria bacterium]|nr:hypothetical protein [Deltaproteobacteria bacterium]
MAQRRSGLAARFRKAVTDAQRARQQSEDATRRAIEAARRARVELLEELEAIAREIGFLSAQRSRDGLTLRYQERYLHLALEGDGELRVEFEGTGDDVHRLFRQAELGDRWVYSRRRRTREDRVPLFDQGLEELFVTALGMPRPGEEPEPPSGPGGRSL